MFQSGSGSPKTYAHQPPVTYGFNRAWDQPEWHIDPINGNDRNVGDTALNPLKTALQYHYRVGTVHEFNKNIALFINSSLPTSDCLNLAGLRPAGGDGNTFFEVNGTSAIIASGIAVSRKLSGNIPDGLSCASLGNLSPYVTNGRMVRKTSGSNAIDSSSNLATAAWLVKDEDGSIARMSFPAYYDRSSSPVQCSQGVINTGDSFDIIDLPLVPNVLFPSASVLFSRVRFRRLRLELVPSFVTLSCGTFIQCSFDNVMFGPSMGQISPSNCRFGSQFYVQPSAAMYITYGAIVGAAPLGNNGRISLQNYTLLQGCRTYAPNYGIEGCGAGISCHTRGFGVYDSPDSGIVIPHGQVWYCNGSIYGSGNVGHPIEIQRGGKLFLDPSGGMPTLTGGVGLSDIILGQKTSGPAINTANPYGYTADRAYSFANLAASVAAGGFGGNIVDPENTNTAIIIGD